MGSNKKDDENEAIKALFNKNVQSNHVNKPKKQPRKQNKKKAPVLNHRAKTRGKGRKSTVSNHTNSANKIRTKKSNKITYGIVRIHRPALLELKALDHMSSNASSQADMFQIVLDYYKNHVLTSSSDKKKYRDSLKGVEYIEKFKNK